MIRLNVAIVGRIQKEKLTLALVTELISAVDAVAQLLDYDAEIGLR